MPRIDTKIIAIAPPFTSSITDLHPLIIPHTSFLNTVNMVISNNTITGGRGIISITPDLTNKTIKSGGVGFKRGKPVGFLLIQDTSAGTYSLKKYEDGVWSDITGSIDDFYPSSSFVNTIFIDGFYHFHNANVVYFTSDIIRNLYRVNLDANNLVNTLANNTQVQGGNYFRGAKYIGIYANFIFLAGLDESSTSGGTIISYPNRLRWSQFNNPTLWSNNPDGTGQSGFMDFSGNTTILALGNYNQFLVIFTNQGVFYLEYVGGSTIHRIRQVITEEDAGVLVSPHAFYILQDTIYFATHRDIYALRGTDLQPLLRGIMREQYIKDITNPLAKYSSMSYDIKNHILKLNVPISSTQTRVYMINLYDAIVYNDLYDTTLYNISSFNDQNALTTDEFMIGSSNVYKTSDTTGLRFGLNNATTFETKIFGSPEHNVLKRVKGIEVIGTSDSSETINVEYLPFLDENLNTYGAGIFSSFNTYPSNNFVFRTPINRIVKAYKIRISSNTTSKVRISMIKIYEETIRSLSV